MSSLTCHISIESGIALGQPTTVQFQIKNSSNRAVKLLPWRLPLEGIQSNCFRVLYNGVELPYHGPLIKMRAPTPEDFIELLPGRSINTIIHLEQAYPILKPGSYQVQFDCELQTLNDESISSRGSTVEEDDLRHVEVKSEQASFNVLPGSNPIVTMKMVQMAKQGLQKKMPPAGPLLASGAKAPKFSGGTQNQQDAVKQAHENALKLSKDAETNIKNDASYVRWFGAHSQTREGIAKSVFSKVSNGIKTKVFTYDLTLDGCQSNYIAYTYHGSLTIWLCNAYWKLPLNGTDSQSGTLVHEHTHASANTDDHAYGTTDCKKLAQQKPDKAVDNGDSFEYYAEGAT